MAPNATTNCGTCYHPFAVHFTSYGGGMMGCSQREYKLDYNGTKTLSGFSSSVETARACTCTGFTSKLKLDQYGNPVQP